MRPCRACGREVARELFGQLHLMELAPHGVEAAARAHDAVHARLVVPELHLEPHVRRLRLIPLARLVAEALFHPDNERGDARENRMASAKKVCARCPVRQKCLQYAFDSGERYGIWGGLNEVERRPLLD